MAFPSSGEGSARRRRPLAPWRHTARGELEGRSRHGGGSPGLNDGRRISTTTASPQSIGYNGDDDWVDGVDRLASGLDGLSGLDGFARGFFVFEFLSRGGHLCRLYVNLG